MIAVVQRVRKASVTVADCIAGHINAGLLVLLSIERADTEAQIRWMAEKLVHLRIFRSADTEKHFDQDVMQIGGSILLVSNFTVAAETAKGRRPSLDRAADPESGKTMFDQLIEAVKAHGVPVATGEFGADMLVALENDGPATFIVRAP